MNVDRTRRDGEHSDLGLIVGSIVYGSIPRSLFHFRSLLAVMVDTRSAECALPASDCYSTRTPVGKVRFYQSSYAIRSSG